MNSEVRFYLSIFWRRLPILLFVFLSVSFTAFAVAVIMPTVYTARGLLLVEAPQIPTNHAQSTVQVSSREQLAVIQRRLMTRANLLEIAREFDVYEEIGTLSPDEIVSRMRSDTRISGSGNNSAATVMEVQFSARSGGIAASVANEYITRILAENVSTRQERAGGTLEFFQQEVERLERELEARNQQILAFQNANADALPDTLNYRLNRQEILQQRMAQIDRDRSVLTDQRDRLTDLQNRGVEFALPDDGEPLTPLEQQLAQLRNQLTNARAIYNEESPRVTVLTTRIAALEELQAEALAAEEEALEPLSGDPVAAADPPTAIELQIDEVNTRLRFLDEQEALIDAELAQLEETLERTPANAIALEGLRRDYDNIERQYNGALDRLSTAATGERIEVMSKGERISVIEQARAPDEPSDPNRPLIAGTGLAAGAGLAIALFAALEVLNRSVRRPVDLANQLGITPIATVHYIVTPGERMRRRVLVLLLFLAVLILVPAALYYIHYEVRPLDLLWARFVEEFRF
ncbi:MAG: lipopolysaccharide biosynthesis protein [Pseudomonadota bacterium]